MSHPDPDLLALAALPAEPTDPHVTEHLQACGACRSHVASLRHTVELAQAGNAEPFDEPDRPPDRVWASISTELRLDEDTDAEPTPATPRRARPSRRRLAAVAVAAALIGLLAGVGVTTLADAPPAGRVVAQLTPVDAADPGATGTVEMADRGGPTTMTVTLDGVTDTAGADYLEVWLADPTGTRLVAIGALTADGSSYRGEFTTPTDLPTRSYPTIDVSAEKWDGNPGHSRISLLRGQVLG